MGITTALTLQWVVSSSSCTSFWLLLPSSPSPPARLRPNLATDTTVSPPSTDLTMPLDTLDSSLAPVTSPSIVSTRERLRPNLATDTTVSPPSTTPTPTGPECPPPSPPPPALDAEGRGVLIGHRCRGRPVAEFSVQSRHFEVCKGSIRRGHAIGRKCNAIACQ